MPYVPLAGHTLAQLGRGSDYLGIESQVFVSIHYLIFLLDCFSVMMH